MRRPTTVVKRGHEVAVQCEVMSRRDERKQGQAGEDGGHGGHSAAQQPGKRHEQGGDAELGDQDEAAWTDPADQR